MGKRLNFVGRAVPCATLLGLAAWNDQAMQSQAGSHARGSQDFSFTSASESEVAEPQAQNGTGASVTLSSDTYDVSPGSSSVQVTVTLNGALAGRQVAASYATTNGSAVPGVDYTPTTGTIIWNDGDPATKSISIPIGASAGGKQFGLQLISVTAGAGLRLPASAIVAVNPVVFQKQIASNHGG